MKAKDELAFPCSLAMTRETKAKLEKIAKRMKVSRSAAFRKLVDERAVRWKIRADE